MTRAFKVADHIFHLEVPGAGYDIGLEGQYEPFETEPSSDPVFTLAITDQVPAPTLPPVLDQDMGKGETRLVLYREPDGCCTVDMAPDTGIPFTARLRATPGFRQGWLQIYARGRGSRHFAVSNSLMLMYAFSTAALGTLEMHASVIANGGKAYLFLAPSGTGKSTHSSLWLKHIPGSELLNDDNPVVRVLPDGTVMVYGSPWSGKTPCYKAACMPAGAFVRIRRSPVNGITRLGVIESYATLTSSTSGLRDDIRQADGLHSTLEKVIREVPCYVLDCRPDEEAARVCAAEVMK